MDMRRTVVRLASALVAVLLVGLGALLWAQQAQAQEPCDFSFCIDKTASPETVAVGEPVTFTVTQRCASGICIDFADSLIDEVPSGLSIDSVADSQPDYECSTSGNTVTCPLGRAFSSANPFVLTIVATPTECGSFTNTATYPTLTAEATVTVVDCLPTTKQQCKNGGWRDFDYRNQGLCIKDVILRGGNE